MGWLVGFALQETNKNTKQRRESQKNLNPKTRVQFAWTCFWFCKQTIVHNKTQNKEENLWKALNPSGIQITWEKCSNHINTFLFTLWEEKESREIAHRQTERGGRGRESVTCDKRVTLIKIASDERQLHHAWINAARGWNHNLSPVAMMSISSNAATSHSEAGKNLKPVVGHTGFHCTNIFFSFFFFFCCCCGEFPGVGDSFCTQFVTTHFFICFIHHQFCSCHMILWSSKTSKTFRNSKISNWVGRNFSGFEQPLAAGVWLH